MPFPPGWDTHCPPVMNCHWVSCRKLSHMPPWQPARPTPAPTARDMFFVYSDGIAPIVQQGTMRSSAFSASRSAIGSSVSKISALYPFFSSSR